MLLVVLCHSLILICMLRYQCDDELNARWKTAQDYQRVVVKLYAEGKWASNVCLERDQELLLLQEKAPSLPRLAGKSPVEAIL